MVQVFNLSSSWYASNQVGFLKWTKIMSVLFVFNDLEMLKQWYDWVRTNQAHLTLPSRQHKMQQKSWGCEDNAKSTEVNISVHPLFLLLNHLHQSSYALLYLFHTSSTRLMLKYLRWQKVLFWTDVLLVVAIIVTWKLSNYFFHHLYVSPQAEILVFKEYKNLICVV